MALNGTNYRIEIQSWVSWIPSLMLDHLCYKSDPRYTYELKCYVELGSLTSLLKTLGEHDGISPI